MDKKNTLIGFALLFGALALMFVQPAREPAVPEEPVDGVPVETTGSGEETGPLLSEGSPGEFPGTGEIVTDAETGPVLSEGPVEVAEVKAPEIPEETVVLRNSVIEVVFTSHGGGIKEVRMLEYPQEKDSPEPYVFNGGFAEPALAIKGLRGLSPRTAYRMVNQTAHSVTYAKSWGNGVEIQRTYRLSTTEEEGDPYQIYYETRFSNQTARFLELGDFSLSLGTAVAAVRNSDGFFLNFGTFDGRDDDFIGLSKFKGGGLMSIFGAGRPPLEEYQAPGPLVWATVKNQFFTALLTPDNPAVRGASQLVTVGDTAERGIHGEMIFDVGQVSPQSDKSLQGRFYVGPKEFKRLQSFDQEQDRVMQFGFFGFFSKLLLSMMTAIHSLIPNYGLAIILVTVVIKLVFWPLTRIATRSARRMGKLQGPMKELNERFKDDPQRKSQEMLKLYKKYKVNPLAGCLPMFIQIPIFLGFFWMLRTSSELRFADFLWVQDLSQPDTLAVLWGFPINLLPLLMAGTMFIQMRMTPTTMDSTQQKIFMFMPFMMLIFLYNFSSGLCLYWTTQNLMTILQQWLTNRKPEPELELMPDDEPSSEKPVNPLIKKKPRKKSS